MSTAYQKLREEALKLPKAHRAALMSELAMSFEKPGASEGLDAAWDAEIEQRVKEIHSGKVKLYISEEVRRDMRARLERAKKKQKRGAVDPVVEAAWEVEVARRAEEVESGHVKLVSGDVVMREIRRVAAGEAPRRTRPGKAKC